MQLRFPTTKSESLHVEHRSTDRTYPLHVFRDGKIVNDYYVLSGRFNFNRSNATWNFLVKNVQLSDAGTYVCSEDNGMGKQYTKELLVIGENYDEILHNNVLLKSLNFRGLGPFLPSS